MKKLEKQFIEEVEESFNRFLTRGKVTRYGYPETVIHSTTVDIGKHYCDTDCGCAETRNL